MSICNFVLADLTGNTLRFLCKVGNNLNNQTIVENYQMKMGSTDSIQFSIESSVVSNTRSNICQSEGLLDEHIAFFTMFQGSTENLLFTFSYFLYLFCESLIAQL